jgi:hypothetical protein
MAILTLSFLSLPANHLCHQGLEGPCIIARSKFIMTPRQQVKFSSGSICTKGQGRGARYFVPEQGIPEHYYLDYQSFSVLRPQDQIFPYRCVSWPWGDGGGGGVDDTLGWVGLGLCWGRRLGPLDAVHVLWWVSDYPYRTACLRSRIGTHRSEMIYPPRS